MAPYFSVAATRLIAAPLLALALCIFIAPVVWAHAVLLETSPEDGVRLDVAPREAWLRFNEPVNPVAVRVLDAGGETVTAPDAIASDGETLRIALPDDLKEGSYIISYRVTSGDGHPVAGSIVFGVGTAAGIVTPDLTASNGIAIAAVVVRALHYAALLATAGGGLFIILVLGHRNPCEGSSDAGLVPECGCRGLDRDAGHRACRRQPAGDIPEQPIGRKRLADRVGNLGRHCRLDRSVWPARQHDGPRAKRSGRDGKPSDRCSPGFGLSGHDRSRRHGTTRVAEPTAGVRSWSDGGILGWVSVAAHRGPAHHADGRVSPCGATVLQTCRGRRHRAGHRRYGPEFYPAWRSRVPW